MSAKKLKLNIAANFIGNFYVAILNLLVIPIYIDFLGLGSYGIVSLYTTLYYVFLSVVDYGLGVAFSREIAIRNDTGFSIRLLFTAEKIYLLLGFLIFFLLIFCKPIILADWGQIVSNKTYLLLCLSLVFRGLSSLYVSVLNGCQKSIVYNIINASVETLKVVSIFSWFVLSSANITLFFFFQCVSNVILFILLYIFTWRQLKTFGLRYLFSFDWIVMKDLKRFALISTLIYLSAGLITQVDKLLLTRYVSLEEFGCYSTVSLLAFALGRFVGPIFNAMYPALAEAKNQNNTSRFVTIFHSSTQLISILTIPVTMVIFGYTSEILLYWTHNQQIVDLGSFPLKLLVIGMLFNGFYHSFYAITLSTNETKIILIQNIIALLLQIILIPIVVPIFSLNGAAFVWLFVNLLYFILFPHLVKDNVFRKEKINWYLYDTCFPLLITCISTLLSVEVLKFFDISFIIKCVLLILVSFNTVIITTALGRDNVCRIWRILYPRLCFLLKK
jgi:O-antigen/teichoic acid export membrane protein